MPKPEVGGVGMTFAESEVRHADVYSHLLDVLWITEDFEEVTEVPAIAQRIKYLDSCLEHSESDDTCEYVRSVLLFSAFVEHVSLFLQSLIMTSFDKHQGCDRTAGSAAGGGVRSPAAIPRLVGEDAAAAY
jgi:ribonucleoside-diphosphate reductase beta chain